VGRFFAELRRRRVFRVVGGYAIAAWAMVEVATTTFPLLGFSEAAEKVVLVAALLGFPLAVALSWMFDLTPDGLRRTAPIAAPGEQAPDRGQVPAYARALGTFGVGVLVALVGFAAWARFGHAPGEAAATMEGIRSIAVLPFVDMSAARDQEYFADGMTEELLNSLAQIEGLHVAARTSSFAFKGKNEDVAEIGRRLRVQAVLEGSVRREGEHLRVTAQLVDARTGYHLWSDNYDRESGEVFAIQDELARAIVNELQLQFAPTELAARGTGNARAHDLYLLGLSRWHRRTATSLQEALEYFHQAVREDSLYARAWAGLAQTYVLLPALADVPFDEALEKGTVAAAQAIELDATLAEAHGALGQIAQTFEWDLAGAERAYRRAVRFDSAYATGHQWYAEALMMLGRTDEAEVEITRALERDPLAPAALAVQGYLFLVTGRTETALGAYTDALRLHPDFTLGRLNLIFALLFAGRREEAAAHIDRLGMSAALTADARAVALATTSADASAALNRLDNALPRSIAALWHASAGDINGAVDLLELALAERRDGNLPFVLLHPLLLKARGDARFAAIVERVGVALTN
jgi:TolB-like protein/Tfp pilus assembly protein PilF